MVNMRPLKFGLVGCGLIGKKRAKALVGLGELVACSDINLAAAKDVAILHNAQIYESWADLINHKGLDAVIIATQHNALPDIALHAIVREKHVFIEKPAAQSSERVLNLINASKKFKVKVHVGFNHRYHRAFVKAKQIISSGELGSLMFIRGRYGHGGRLGYEKEWRSDPKLSGGGELIDQGSHLIDLSRWILGEEFTDINGFATNYFWQMPVDDNGFLVLKTQQGKTAFLHASCTEWKNLFSMEIYGKYGKLEISGLGGSYGLEKITHYRMLPQMGPPETQSWEFPMEDNSWGVELQEFVQDILLDRQPSSGLADAYAVLKVIEKIYKDSGYDYYS